MKRKMTSLKLFFSLLALSSSCLLSAAAVNTAPQQDVHPSVLHYAKAFQKFRDLHFKEHEKEFIRLVEEGQTPHTLFIGCSDSRVIPELITQSNPGNLFVIRTAGNFVPNHSPQISWDGVAATIQYGVEYLGIKDIIVCGHSHCGAIRGLFQAKNPQKNSDGDSLSRWLQFGMPAKKIALEYQKELAEGEDIYSLTERLSVLLQIEHLLTYPFIKKAVEEEKIYLHAWYFIIEKGEVEYFEPNRDVFLPLSQVKTKTAPASARH